MEQWDRDSEIDLPQEWLAKNFAMSDSRSDGIMSMCDSQSAKNDVHPSVPVGTANAQVETLANVI
ncbi:hypothetical protein KVV02_003919, partial [Mortierella alpina]